LLQDDDFHELLPLHETVDYFSAMPRRAPTARTSRSNLRQTRLPGAPLAIIVEDDDPVVPEHLNPTLQRAPVESATTHRKEVKRWAWCWQHLPDKDPETRYYNETNDVEWRCGYCNEHYVESGGTRNASTHLVQFHGLNKGDPRGTVVRNNRNGIIQTDLPQSLKRQAEIAEDFHFKRRKMGSGDGSSIDPNRLEMLYTRYDFTGFFNLLLTSQDS
jgi:hypothetical protein